MYIQLGNPKHTPVLLKGASTRQPFRSYDPSLKATWPSWGTPLWGPPRRKATGFPLISLIHGHSSPPNNSSNGQCNTPINFLGTLSRSKVLSFMANCNSGPYYVFGTFELVTTLPTVRSLINTCGTNKRTQGLHVLLPTDYNSRLVSSYRP